MAYVFPGKTTPPAMSITGTVNLHVSAFTYWMTIWLSSYNLWLGPRNVCVLDRVLFLSCGAKRWFIVSFGLVTTGGCLSLCFSNVIDWVPDNNSSSLVERWIHTYMRKWTNNVQELRFCGSQVKTVTRLCRSGRVFTLCASILFNCQLQFLLS